MQGIVEHLNITKNKLIIFVATLIVLVLLFILLRPDSIEILIFADKAKTKHFLVSVEVLSSDGKAQNISVLTRQVIRASRLEKITLSGLPRNSEKITLWIIHPEYRYSRVGVPVPSLWSKSHTVKIAPIDWSTEIKRGIANYDDVMNHLKRISKIYLPELQFEENNSLIQSMGVVNKIVLAADSDIRRQGIKLADYKIRSKALKTTYNRLLAEVNK